MPSISEKLTSGIYGPDETITNYSAIDENYIIRLEDILGTALPSDYRDFLLEFPFVGLCFESERDLPIAVQAIDSSPGAPDGIYEVSYLFSRSNNKTVDLISINSNKNSDLSEYLIFANTSLAAVYGMGIAPNNYGHIFYISWDDGEFDYPLIARSFTEFVDRLIIYELR